jgi:hypothetical protein
MNWFANRRVERSLLAVYAIVGILSAIVFVSTQYLFVSAVAVAWIGFILFWVSVVLALITALVIVSLSIRRAVKDQGTNNLAIIFSISIPLSFLVSIYIIMNTNNVFASVVFGVVGLVISPLLLIMIFYK